MLEAMIREVDAKTARAHRDTRLVPITREQYDVLANLFVGFAGTPVFPVWESNLVHDLCNAWEDAPPDAAEAAAKAIYESEVDPGVTWENARAKTHDECTDMARAVLRALGMPADA